MNWHKIPWLLRFLLKRRYRIAQKSWAAQLHARIAPQVPAPIKCLVSGWATGCAPILEVDELEWVVLETPVIDSCSIGHYWFYPDQPSQAEVAEIVTRFRNHLSGAA